MQYTSCLRICRGGPGMRRPSTGWGLSESIVAGRVSGVQRYALWHVAGALLAAAVFAATANARAERPIVSANGVIHAAQRRDTPAHASKSGGKHSHHKNPSIGPEQAAQRAREKFGGRVLNVVLAHRRAGPYYQVKLLANGRVRVVNIDAHQ